MCLKNLFIAYRRVTINLFKYLPDFGGTLIIDRTAHGNKSLIDLITLSTSLKQYSKRLVDITSFEPINFSDFFW